MRNKQAITFKIVAALVTLAVLNTGCSVIEDILRGLGRYCETPEWTVTTTEDLYGGRNGVFCTAESCSLRQAVATSNACPGTQTIHVPDGSYALSITGANDDLNRRGDLDITDSVNILGGTPGAPSISGAFSDRIFDIKSGATVNMTGIVIRNGQADNGAGIRNLGTLDFHDGTVVGNTASGMGGGIYSTGNLVFYGSEARDNHSGASGAGIAVDGRGAAAPLSFEFMFSTAGQNTAAANGGGIYISEQVNATLSSVIISSGQAARGAGLYNNGNLTGDLLHIDSNIASREGGGLSNHGQAGISHSVFFNNRADGEISSSGGGGVYNESGARLSIDNSTISGNGSNIYGGGIASGGDLQITFSTIANNDDGLSVSSVATTNISNSIVGNNIFNCQDTAPIISGGFNIDSGHGCGFAQPSDLSDTDPLLRLLGDNGGSTRTHALAAGSPALDSADPAACPATDQRRVSRPQPAGGNCDRGAYEADTLTTSAPIVAASPTPTPAPQAIPFILILTQNANCRSGPGTAYESLDAYPAGQSLQVDGRNEMAPWWWQVLIPNSKKHCWVSSASGQPQGDSGLLPVIQVAPPIEPPSDGDGGVGAPAAPSKLAITDRKCTSNKYSVTLGWNDNADDETGYRVYRNGALIATLGANATSYTDNPPGSGPYTYSVEAFNAAGASAQPTVNEEGCLI